MTVHIRPDQEQGIKAMIQGGRFRSVDEFIQTAIDEALRRASSESRWDAANAYGRARAAELGIGEDDVDRLIHEYRQENKPGA